MKKIILIILLFGWYVVDAQVLKSNSDTRNFIDDADFTQINRDWSLVAEFKSGIGEVVSFFPVEIIDLKTNQKVYSLQMDMTVKYSIRGNDYTYFKSSWLDLKEVDEFIIFLRKYVSPNLNSKVDSNQSTTYVFNSKELVFNFLIEKNIKRISIYLKDQGITDYDHYFWTQSQVNTVPSLINVLTKISK